MRSAQLPPHGNKNFIFSTILRERNHTIMRKKVMKIAEKVLAQLLVYLLSWL